jgi:hypothetical protein
MSATGKQEIAAINAQSGAEKPKNKPKRIIRIGMNN